MKLAGSNKSKPLSADSVQQPLQSHHVALCYGEYKAGWQQKVVTFSRQLGEEHPPGQVKDDS